MLRSRPARAFALVSWLALGASCGGGGFEPSSKVQGLRVLAMQKEPPYAKPGETVLLKLLYWDGKVTEGTSRNIKFDFFQCQNPPGDLYYGCFSQLGPLRKDPNASDAGLDPSAGDASDEGDAAAPTPDDASIADAADLPDAGVADASDPPDAGASDLPDASLDATSDDGAIGADAGPPPSSTSIRTNSLYIPPGIIRPRPPGVTPYGLVYVLFTACAGHLDRNDTAGTQNGLPIACFDNDDPKLKLGPDDFVPGYASIYVYDSLRNANPIVKDMSFRGMSLTNSFDAADADVPHVERCTQSNRGDCPTYELKVDVDRASAETDPEAKDPSGNPLQEQLWVAYHSTDGDFSSSLRLVNDATHGWNEDQASKFRAPAKPGPVRVFGIVHDNRGGVGWALGKIIVD